MSLRTQGSLVTSQELMKDSLAALGRAKTHLVRPCDPMERQWSRISPGYRYMHTFFENLVKKPLALSTTGPTCGPADAPGTCE